MKGMCNMTRCKWSASWGKRNIFGLAKKSRRPGEAWRRRLFVEALESREVPSAGVLPNPNETVDTSLSAAQLASMLVGPGVAVSNATFTGGTAAKGSFTFNDPTVVGFGQGIVLSSGSAADVVGPNVSDFTSTDFGLPGDPNLDALSGFTTYDAAVLEFDFTPIANQVTFQYTFASDEYPEWVNTSFNDVFAFYVNGTNYATVRQVAGDPNSPFVPVAVNNINNGNALYPDYAPMRPDLFRANYYDPNGPSAIDLEQDGLTSVLTFQAPVTPGVSNHMKLAIADASDGIYDSAVFIQAGSLVSNENPVADLSLTPQSGAAPLIATAIVEGKDPNGLTITYSIDWGDGATSSGPLNLPSNESEKTTLVNHTYNAPGDYVVTLTVSNGSLSGVSKEDIHVTGVGAAPIITANPINQSVLEGDPFTFTATASGLPVPSVQWQVSSDSGLTFADIQGATNTTYTATATLADNGNLFQAVFTNSAGAATTSAAALAVTPVDVTPPAPLTVALAQDTGTSNVDKVTRNGTLNVGGIETGALVEYSADNGATWKTNFTAVEGPNVVLVRQTDAAGNVSGVTSFGFTLDTVAPPAPGVKLTQDTGASATDKITKVGALTLSGVESGAAVQYSTNNGAAWTGAFSAKEGANNIKVRQTDAAGNLSTITAFSFALDTTAPVLHPAFNTTAPILVNAKGVKVSVNATDASGIASQSAGAVITSTPGLKYVACSATDIAGNSASMNVSYVVGYAVVNVTPKSGATFKKSTGSIPVSFRLADANGVISDQTALSLLPSITITLDGLTPVGVTYNAKTNLFSASLKTSTVSPGDYNITIRVTLSGTDVAKAVIPIHLRA